MYARETSDRQFFTTSYYKNVVLHNTYQSYELHRKYGPSKIDSKLQLWTKKDEIHRIDGPAIIGTKKEWWFEDKRITEHKYWNM